MTAAAASPRIYMIAAVAANGVIGASGRVPWHLPEDLQHFRRLTLGHSIIMGRKTWQSIGKALPQRNNIVLTRHANLNAPGTRVVSSLDEALALCDDVAFVIGGSDLYQEAMPRAVGLFLTELKDPYPGDTYFPQLDRRTWNEIQREPRVAANGIRFDFVRYERATGAASR